MTSNNALKKAAREHAAKTGVSYTQARREIMDVARDVVNALAPSTERWVEFQQESRDDMTLPLPFTIDHFGFVDRQEFWRGDPWRLVGFVTDPTEYVVDLQREEFLTEPERAVGMHPVFMDRKRKYATWKGAVADVETRDVEIDDPDSVRAEFYIRTPAGERTATMGVGHLVRYLTLDEIDQMRADGWGSNDVTEDLLVWLNMTGNDKALDFSAFMDDVEDDDLVLKVHLNTKDAEAWYAREHG